MNKNIIFRVDASPEIGTGHLMRCLSFAKELKKNNYNIYFISYNYDDSPILNFLKDSNFELILIKNDITPYSTSESNYLSKISNKLNTKLIILDNYSFNYEYFENLHKYSKSKIFVIDDLADRNIIADYVLNQNIYAFNMPYKKITNESCNLLLGLDYLLLRDEFTNDYIKIKTIKDKAENILITLGGSDPKNQTKKILKAIDKIKNISLNVKIVIGLAYRYKKELESIVEKINKNTCTNIKILVQVKNMSFYFDWADIAIAAGGTTFYELMLYGVPTILLMIAQNQKFVCEYAMNKDLAINLSWYEDINSDDINNSLNELIHSKEKRKYLSNNCQNSVSKLGIKNIISKLNL